MRYLTDKPSRVKIEKIIDSKGIQGRTLSKLMYGDGTHREFLKEIDKNGDMYISTLVRLCNILDVSIEELLADSEEGNIPAENGNNTTESTCTHNNVATLQAEVRMLKAVLEEKDKRLSDKDKQIADLGKRLDFVLSLKLGQNSDTNE